MASLSKREHLIAHYIFLEPTRKIIHASKVIKFIDNLFKSEMVKSRQFPSESLMGRRVVAVILRYNAKHKSVIEYMNRKG